jgi:CheY-like chemotaxis protein
MIKILLAGENLASRPAFKAALGTHSTQITCLDSGARTLSAVAQQHFDLLVADEDVGDMSGLDLIKAIVTQSPLLNCALVSALAPNAFHEASEGLGVLMQLPVEPGPEDAAQLLERLAEIQSYTNKTVPRGS